ncbi:hypothetical protein [Streptomyces sp. NBC_00344]|uniref:hypothetical protein n=1 Tax=Streptomyces sp. NBC_00344 TaxID=2975720 RepID=UPI002E1C8772
MPRPTAAQLAYGSATVIFSTLAMLLLSRTSSGVGVAVIVVAALVLGLLVATSVPMPGSAHPLASRRTGSERPADISVPVAAPASVRVRTPRAGAERVGEHSLRG